MPDLVLYLLAFPVLLYFILWAFLPKGSLAHELLHLLPFWWRLARQARGGFREERFSYGLHRRQYFLLCIPEKGIPLREHALFYFHGGGWRYGAPEQFRPHARQLTRLGFAVLLPSYRRAPRHNYRHMREDLTLLLSKAREVLAQKGMAGKKAIIGGMSAGGNMAALAALDQDALPAAHIPPAWIGGLFLFGAPLQLEKMADTITLRHFAGPRGEPMFRKANPFYYLDKKINIPTLIIHGTKDGMTPFAGAEEFAGRLRKVNAAETLFVVLPGGTHLDAASWFFREGEGRRAFMEWLEGL